MTALRMTPGRRIALVAGVPLALVAIGWSALSGVAWAGLGSFPVSLRLPAAGREVSIAVDAGQVSVRPAAGPVRVRGTAHYALIRSAVSWRRTAAGVALQSRCRVITGPCWFDYQVTVPPARRVAVSDSAGPISVRGLSGQVSLEDAAGDIRASQISGALLIRADAGVIAGSAITGPRAAFHDAAGDIAVTGLASPVVTATAAAGDITLAFASVPSDVQVTCAAGDVRLVLPPGGAVYRVVATAALGTSSVQVPTSPSSPHVITVTDEAGNIVITR